MAEIVPLNLSGPKALKMVRELAADSANVVLVAHVKRRGKQRHITRRQIELCALKGVLLEEPFLNSKGNWQVTIRRLAAGEEVTCVIAIDWPKKLIVITAFR